MFGHSLFLLHVNTFQTAVAAVKFHLKSKIPFQQRLKSRRSRSHSSGRWLQVPLLPQVNRCSLTASLSSSAPLTRTRTKGPVDSPRFLAALPTRPHPLCPSRGVCRLLLACSGALCRAAVLLATLHQPLGLISVGTRSPSLPLRAPSLTAHASNSTFHRAYDLPAQCLHGDPPPPTTATHL